MIDGLKLMFSGEELRTRLDEGIERHEEAAAHWTREAQRTKDDETDDHPLLPPHICHSEAVRHTWRATVLAFIRDHLDASEIYRMGAADPEFGELLPTRPESVDDDDDDDDGNNGESDRDDWCSGEVIADNEECRATRLDMSGLEIIKIERR
jgi:hypothetical protein